MRKNVSGFTLVELLVALVTMGIVMAGVAVSFSVQNRTYIEQDLTVAMEENLRVGIGVVTDILRNGGYGVPTSNLAEWITWRSGFTTSPVVIDSRSGPLSVAACFGPLLATLSVAAARGASTLTLDSNAGLNTINRHLIRIGGLESAHVTSVRGTQEITIDRDPSSGNQGQGLGRAYTAGAPICRVDVRTFIFDAASGSLLLDENHGEEPVTLVEGISDFDVALVGGQYEIALTGQTEVRGPISGDYIERSLTSTIALRN